MTSKYDSGALRKLFNEAYHAELTTEKTEADLKAYMKKLFGEGAMPSTHELHQFNNLVIEKVNEITKEPRNNEILDLLADRKVVPAGTIYQYDLPRHFKAKVVWTANGTSVEHTRVEGKQSKIATPTKIATGFYYETLSMASGDVEMFRTLVNDVAQAKQRLYFQTISQMLQNAIASGEVPPVNVLNGTNLTLENYNKVSRVLERYGGRPVFIADNAMIDHFGSQQGAPANQHLLYDEMKKALQHDLVITQIGRTVAIPLVNDYVWGSQNTKTWLPINEGYMIASGQRDLKPFKIVEWGGMTQFTNFNYNLERVEMKLYLDIAFEFVQSDTMAYIKDDSIKLY